ncbi:MAG: hypothetical protein JWM06_1242 [Actinomycetia bacterium]|nr:hypothetical protein [Actinomycetes bacterium]
MTSVAQTSLVTGLVVRVGAEIVVEGSEAVENRCCCGEILVAELRERCLPALAKVCVPLGEKLASARGERAVHDSTVAFGAGALDEAHLGEAVEQLGDGCRGEVGGERELARRQLVALGEASKQVVLGEAELAVAVGVSAA